MLVETTTPLLRSKNGGRKVPEPLTSSLLAELLPKLIVAFPRNLGAKDPVMMADVYRNGLRGLSGDAVRFAVDRAIQEDEYFPKVARLRELATEWSRRTNAVIETVTRSSDELTCSVCGAKAQQHEVTRQVVKRTKFENGREKFEEQWEESNGRKVPKMETVIGQRLTMIHDRRRHGITERHESDAA